MKGEIKVLARLLKPKSGSVRLDGREWDGYSQADLSQCLGLVFQNPNDQLFGATVAEDVAFGPRNLGLAENEVRRRVDEALDSVGACELRERAIHHLSFGEQKRVAIADVLAMKPSILILDKPTAGLDPAHPGDSFGRYAVVVCRPDLPPQSRSGAEGRCAASLTAEGDGWRW